MAITDNDVKLLFYSKTLGVDFRNVLTLGRLRFYGSPENIKLQASRHHYPVADFNLQFDDGYSEPLFRFLGAETCDSMDYSDYEKATIIHDLNKKVDERLHNRFSVIVDSGTIEHVFNFPVAIASCMNMIKVNGHYIGISPANNLLGHGFYQFSHELFYRIFSAANGFETVKIMITSTNARGESTEWYEVLDPEKIKERIVFSNDTTVYIMVIAKKVRIAEVFATYPIQSDYAAAWKESKQKETEDDAVKKVYRKILPRKIRDFFYLLRQQLSSSVIRSSSLGELNSRHFRKVDPGE